MHKITPRGGRPRSNNKRTIISQVHLTPEEAALLHDAGKRLGVPYLSKFIRAAACAYVFQRSKLVDTRVSRAVTLFGSLAMDINDLYELSLPLDVQEEIHITAREAKQKALTLHKILLSMRADITYD